MVIGGAGGLFWIVFVIMLLNASLILYVTKLNKVYEDYPRYVRFFADIFFIFIIAILGFFLIAINYHLLEGAAYFFVYLCIIRLIQFFFEEGKSPRKIVRPVIFLPLTIIFLILVYFLINPKRSIYNTSFKKQISTAMNLRFVETVSDLDETSIVKVDSMIIAGSYHNQPDTPYFYLWNYKKNNVGQKIHTKKNFHNYHLTYRNDTIYNLGAYESGIEKISVSDGKVSELSLDVSQYPTHISTLNFYKNKAIISVQDTISILDMNNKKIKSFHGRPLNIMYSGNFIFANYGTKESNVSCYDMDKLTIKWTLKLTNVQVNMPRYLEVLLSPENATSTPKYIGLPTDVGITIIRKENGQLVHNYTWKKQYSYISPKHKLIGNFLYYNFGNDILVIDIETSQIKRRYKNAYLKGVYNNKIVATSLDNEYYLTPCSVKKRVHI